MKVSFVITVYNKAAFLPGVIAALKAQTGTFAREYVFVNDGSTDTSWDVVQSLTSGWDNLVLIDQKNQGVTKATNTGVAAASGDFIKLVDADDILAPFCTDLLLNTLQDSDSDFVFGVSGDYDTEVYFEDPENPEVVVFDDPLFSVIDRGFARVSHCLFKKMLFEAAGGCDERIFSQDHSLFIRLSSRGRLAQVHHIVCVSPKDEPGRIMNNEAQVIHDATIALAYHLDENVDMSHKQKGAAQKKIILRVWRWAKKVHGASFLSAEFALYLLMRCGMTVSPKHLISLCAVFRKNAQVRQPLKKA
ncbi:MAG: glycosyltransferase [Methylocystaceae bacterium]|nr:glycosyltransferase [Methylocystaceae bacterium]